MASKLTREELLNIIETDHVQCGEASALARMALAAMDSEPVGYFGRSDPDDEDIIDQCSKNVKGAFPLYRHAQPAPVVNEDLYKLANHIASSKNGLPDEWQGWADELETDIRRAAMLQAGSDEIGSWSNSKNTPTSHSTAAAYPETLPCPVLLEPGMRFSKGIKTSLVLKALQRRAEHYAELEAMSPEERAEYDANIEAFKAMLQAGNLTNEDTRQVDELTMWIKRLVRSLKNSNPDSKLPRQAMDYLTDKGLISAGDILR